MKNKTLTYYAVLDDKTSPGVAKKILNTVAAANELGVVSSSKVFSPNDKFSLFVGIIKENSDYIYIRYPGWISYFLFFVLVYKRLIGSKVIIDIPTPRVIGLKEIEDSERSYFRKLISKVVLICAGSWVLWPAHRIIQYADESTWFSWGVKNKSIKIGNGININLTTPLVEKTLRDDSLNLIAVAQLAGWHGYDRLISAIALLKDKYPEFKVSLKIVGDGTALPKLKSLVSNFKLEDNVVFTGFLYGKDLDDAFEGMHLAVASLGLYRIGLSEASVLKTREYMARGLCVIGVGKDPDFPDNSPYRFLVPNNDEIEVLSELIYKLKDEVLPSPKEVRGYAQKNLTLKAKVEKILNFNEPEINM